MLYGLDLCGTLIFAISGALKGIRHELDVLGVLVLAVATGIGGGIIRDLFLGATPPAVFQDEWYFVICIVGGLVTFYAAPPIAQRWNRVMVADAIGLGVFAVIGASKGIAYGLGPIGVTMMGALTATGGGVVRDVLVREVPAVIQRDFYATAALIGSLCLWGLHTLGAGPVVQAVVTIGVTTALRFYAMEKNLNLPRATSLTQPDD